MLNKIILINKEKNYTSRDIVNIISKKFKTKKVGHFGTLDPLATGLLVIGINSLTKIGNFPLFDDKTYKAEVLIGTSTDTYDITGNIMKQEIKDITQTKLEQTLKSFIITYNQEVPIFSATKVNGKKLYEYARKGEKVTLPKKEVTIYDIKDIKLYKKNNNKYFSFICKVSKGTYIRSLINDISKKLDIPLCMSNLERLSQGIFNIKDANTLEDIKNDNYKLLDIRDILDVKVVEIPKNQEKIIQNGGVIPKTSNNYILYTKDKEDLFLYGPYKDKMKPYLTFKNTKK